MSLCTRVGFFVLACSCFLLLFQLPFSQPRCLLLLEDGSCGDRSKRPIRDSSLTFAPTTSGTSEAENLPPKRNDNSKTSIVPEPPRCVVKLFESLYTSRNPVPEDVSSNKIHTAKVVDAVYVVHYTKLKRRRIETAKRLAEHGLTRSRWIEGLDADDITPDMWECLHTNYSFRNSENPIQRQRHDPSRGGKAFQKFRPSQLSVVSKHHLAAFDMVKNGFNIALILEDDVALRYNFTGRIREVVAFFEANQNATGSPGFDIIMVGGCLKMFAQRPRYRAARVAKNIYEKPEARCAHAYLLSLNGAHHLLASMPLTLPIDYQLTAAMREWKLRGYWIEPWLSAQVELDGCVTQNIGYHKCASTFSWKKLGPFYNRTIFDNGAPLVDSEWEKPPVFRK